MTWKIDWWSKDIAAALCTTSHVSNKLLNRLLLLVLYINPNLKCKNSAITLSVTHHRLSCFGVVQTFTYKLDFLLYGPSCLQVSPWLTTRLIQLLMLYSLLLNGHFKFESPLQCNRGRYRNQENDEVMSQWLFPLQIWVFSLLLCKCRCRCFSQSTLYPYHLPPLDEVTMEEVGQTTQLRAGELIIIVVVLIMWAGEVHSTSIFTQLIPTTNYQRLSVTCASPLRPVQVWSLSSAASMTSSKTTSPITTRTKPKTPLSAALLSIRRGVCCAVRYNPPNPLLLPLGDSPPTPQRRRAGESSRPLLDLVHCRPMVSSNPQLQSLAKHCFNMLPMASTERDTSHSIQSLSNYSFSTVSRAPMTLS